VLKEFRIGASMGARGRGELFQGSGFCALKTCFIGRTRDVPADIVFLLAAGESVECLPLTLAVVGP